MNLEIILVIVFFVVLISIQYTLNKILSEIRNIKKVLEKTGESEFRSEKVKKRI